MPELVNRFTYAAIEDADYLWVSTNKGLACVNLINNTLKYFEVGDGIQSNEFNPPALKLDDNMILFGGINGITGFYTAQIEKDINRVPKLYFTSLKVDGQLIEVGKPVERSKHNIRKQLEYAGRLRLEPHEKILSLEFAALEYFAPERIKYFYRILPNSTNWIPLKDQNFVTFVNLNPGQYTLQVRSTNSDDQLVDNIRTLNIIVDPPYYQTFWFIALCILLVSGLVFLAIRMRFIGLQRNTIVLEKEVMERTKKIETQKREIEIQRNIASHQRDKITEQRDQLERLMQNLELKVKERTLELEIAKFKAEESDRLKSAFLSNMSHEIRTPMNAIIGFSELLLEQTFDPDEKQGFAELIRSNGDHLLNLLNDIIDISMIESGQLKLVPSRINFNDLISDVYLNFKRHQTLIAKQGKVNFILKPLSQNISLYTDPLRVKQVLYNLVSNAIKFTAEGTIEMGYEINGSMLHVYVQDSGIGIAPENQKYVFERFRKIDGGKRNLYGGFGLGLTISRNLIESLGGRIWLESYVGKGTTFYFTLPLTNEQRPNNYL
jgi:signal transduction histidine kinase